MSKFIKYNDYVQINPDRKILSLDKIDKIKLIDNMLERSYSGGKGLVITYDLSHSGRRINNRIYSTAGQKRGIESLTEPYPKPILKNHDQGGEPIGRFIGGEWQNLYDEARDFLQSSQAALDINNAFLEDDPEKIYKTLKSFDLINNRQWPGLGRMRVQANITDEEAIKKFMDGRYLTFSAGSTTDRHVCSICNTDWAQDGMCEHRHGKTYDGEICVFITGDFLVMEGSVVNTPADDLSQLVHMEMMDSIDSKESTIDKNIHLDEFILTDSIYNFGETDELQATKQSDSEKEKEKVQEETKKIVDEKYDHQMTISESSMKELHEKGVTYITQSSGEEKMIIKINYSGSIKKESSEKDFELFENEILELVEELTDEKTFKVPAGAKGNAQKVLNWKKEKGSEVKGMTPVGWARARQLATKSEIGISTVRRMAAFNRHRKNAAVDPKFKSEPWKDRGYVAWLGWGGTSGIDWAVKVSASNRDSLYNGISEKDKERFLTPLSEMIADFDLDNCELDKFSTKEKDFKMTDKETTEELKTKLEEMAASAKEILTEDQKEAPVEREEEETEAPPAIPPEPVEDNLLEEEWKLLDLAFEGILSKNEVAFSKETRDALEDSVFCGPNRMFPIGDCAHVEAAKELVANYKISDEVKVTIDSHIEARSKVLGCEKSNDYLELEAKFNVIQKQYEDLEDKFKTVLESILAKNTEKVTEEVEKEIADEVIDNNQALLDNKVESPSEHIQDENISQKKESKLPVFEQKIVDKFKELKNSEGEYAAMLYLESKAQYLPRGFNPNKF